MRLALVLLLATAMACDEPDLTPTPETQATDDGDELAPPEAHVLPERSDEPIPAHELERDEAPIDLSVVPPGPRDPELLALLRAYQPAEYSNARHDRALIAIAQKTVEVAQRECSEDLETAKAHADATLEELVEAWAVIDRLRAAGEDLEDAEDEERAAWDGARDAMRMVRDACATPGVLGLAVDLVERNAPRTI